MPLFATLHAHGAAGIIGTGQQAIPALAGSVAFARSEIFFWNVGLSRRPHEACHAAIALATGIGALLNVLPAPLRVLGSLPWSWRRW